MQKLNALTLCVAMLPAYMAGLGAAVAAEQKGGSETHQESETAQNNPGGEQAGASPKAEGSDAESSTEADASQAHESAQSKTENTSGSEPDMAEQNASAESTKEGAQPGPQSDTKASESSEPSSDQTASGSGARSASSGGPLYTGDLMGRDVMSRSSYQKIGSVKDFKLNGEGQIGSVIVHVGGFLGIGSKDVAIPWNEFERLPADDGESYLITVDQDAASLEDAPSHERKSTLNAPSGVSQ